MDVNAIAPGALNTRLLDEVLAAGPERVGDAFYEQARGSSAAGCSLRRGAELSVCLASAASDGVTGKLLSAVGIHGQSCPSTSRSSTPTSIRCGASCRATGSGLGRRLMPGRPITTGTPWSARSQQPALRPPRGSDCVPDFDLGWRREDGGTDPFITYVDDDHAVNWSDDLEELHEESSRTHFIDVWTRQRDARAARALTAESDRRRPWLLDRLPARGPARAPSPTRSLIGVDLVAAGLRKAHANVPDAASAAGRRVRAAARGRERRSPP